MATCRAPLDWGLGSRNGTRNPYPGVGSGSAPGRRPRWNRGAHTLRIVFAAGDVNDGRDKQVIIAAAEGAKAALAAFNYLVHQA